MSLYDLIGNLKDIGFYDILLPWALFFAITYGLLTSVGPFSTKKEEGKEPTDQSIPAIISMAIAFFIIVYTPFGLSLGSYLAILFGKSGTIIIGILAILLFLGMAGIKMEDAEIKKYNTTIAFALIAIVTIIYLGTGKIFGEVNIPGITEDIISTIILLIVLIGGVIWLTKK